MEIEIKRLIEDFEPRKGRSFSDSDIAKALDGVEFPAYIQVVGSYSNHFGWTSWDLIDPNGSRYEQHYNGSVVQGFWADSYECAHRVLSSYEDEYYIEHPEDSVEAEWEISEEGISVQYSHWTDSFGRGEEKTKISFPSGWGTRRKINKVSWLKGQDEVRSTPYLLKALEVWGTSFGDGV